MLTTLILTLLTQTPGDNPTPSYRAWRDASGWRSTPRANGRSGAGLAFFEFAPASGAGMGAACTCTTPTGAKGEVMTFTRTGAATCSKQGLATTGISDGDLVVCSGNQPRVESSGGVLGLRVESSRTNSTIRSEEIDNAAWVVTGVLGPAAPTITANFAVAPDGTTTADRVQVSACAPVGSASVVFQNYTGTAAAWTGSVYLRGNGGSGSVLLYLFDSTAALGNGVTCSFVSGSWSRCEIPRTFANATHRLGIGCVNDAVISGSGNTGAADVLVWGVQSEAGAYATSYIPTVAAAVTRNVEAPSFSLGTGSWGCESASFSVAGYTASGNNQRVLALAVDASNLYDQYINFSGASLQHFTFLSATTRQHATSNAPAAAGSVSRVVYRQNGTTLVTVLDGTTTTSTPSAYTALTGATTLHLGKYTSGGFELNGIITRVQVDLSPSRCSL